MLKSWANTIYYLFTLGFENRKCGIENRRYKFQNQTDHVACSLWKILYYKAESVSYVCVFVCRLKTFERQTLRSRNEPQLIMPD